MNSKYLVRWYEDEACNLFHDKVFRDLAEAEECVTYLRSTGKVYNVTLKKLRPHKER